MAFKENLHFAKKILLSSLRRNGLFTITLLNKEYKVYYEGSRRKGDRDDRFLKAVAVGKKCIMDIGANIGLATLLMTEGNNAVVHAFEASEYAAKLIIQHAAANRIADRVRVINTLVTDEVGATIPFYWEFNSGGASIYKGRLGHHFPIIKSSITIDAYAMRENLKPDLLKIDVEGAEFAVIKGSIHTMATHKPLVFLELHAAGDLPLWRNAEQINEIIQTIEYKMIYLRTKSPVIDSRVLEMRGRCHVLLCDNRFNFEEFIRDWDTSAL